MKVNIQTVSTGQADISGHVVGVFKFHRSESVAHVEVGFRLGQPITPSLVQEAAAIAKKEGEATSRLSRDPHRIRLSKGLQRHRS